MTDDPLQVELVKMSAEACAGACSTPMSCPVPTVAASRVIATVLDPLALRAIRRHAAGCGSWPSSFVMSQLQSSLGRCWVNRKGVVEPHTDTVSLLSCVAVFSPMSSHPPESVEQLAQSRTAGDEAPTFVGRTRTRTEVFKLV